LLCIQLSTHCTPVRCESETTVSINDRLHWIYHTAAPGSSVSLLRAKGWQFLPAAQGTHHLSLLSLLLSADHHRCTHEGGTLAGGLCGNLHLGLVQQSHCCWFAAQL
jgi:hypothetical protein